MKNWLLIMFKLTELKKEDVEHIELTEELIVY